MDPQKMVEHIKQKENMFSVVTLLRSSDIIDNHIPNSLQALLLMQEIRSESGSRNLWKLLVLRYG
jgi:hypothetical protein